MWIDIVLGVILGFGIIIGIINGAIREFFALLGVVFGLYIASKAYTKLAVILNLENVRIVSFVLIFIVIAIFIYLLGLAIYQFLRFLRLGFLDRLLGMVFGVIKGTLLAGILCFFISLLPDGQKVINESKIAPIVFKNLHLIKGLFPENIQDKLKWRTSKEANNTRHQSFVVSSLL